jgi:hypothetical protein
VPNDDYDELLLKAIGELTQVRQISTTQLDDSGHEVRTHVEPHPPLLLLLAYGTGISRGSRKSETRIPIDAEKLEQLAQIRDTARAWSRDRGLEWQDDADWIEQLRGGLVRWYGAHAAARSRGFITDEEQAYTLRVVQGWADRIARKYEPDETREWTEACPHIIEEDGYGRRRCNARRVKVGSVHGEDAEERFAITVNVTRMSAECASCGTRWDGIAGLSELRFLTNLWTEEAAKLEAEAEAVADAAEQIAWAHDDTSTGPIPLHA